ncbi:cell wall-binding repeat-containing protein [Lentibacillus sp. JNUCC-1]|uniref:cell wall-binding repeat-containing protein n=1 Tax=Lentibacillus sp. JNUCC-1 TaxID=2654513 RepID=UPI002F910F72
MFLAPQISFADQETGSKEFYFERGETKTELSDNKKIIVSNEKKISKFTIQQNGRTLFDKELLDGNILSLKIITVDNQEYALVVYRQKGSDNALSFDVLTINGSKVNHQFNSDYYSRGKIMIDNNKIKLQYPEYEAEDSMTEPSRIIEQEFVVTSKGVEVGEKRTELAKLKPTSFMSLQGSNPDFSEVNDILTEEALKAEISPEILKAIASQESSWEQYWSVVPKRIKGCKKDSKKGTLAYDGTNAKLGYDCIGVGIMQISNHMYMDEGPAKEAYINRLKTDIRFNIQEGIKILKQKWNYSNSGLIPTVNDNDPMVIENWYFAIMAYNGLLPRNNPLERPYVAYQERVFERMKDYSLIDLTPFPTHTLKPYIRSDGILQFKNDNIKINGPVHLSSQSLAQGDTAYVTVNGLNMRKTPGGTTIGSLSKGTKVTVTGKYSGNNSRVNQYIWMPIKTSNGQTGWVASSYLDKNGYIKSYALEGVNRYDTAVSIGNHGWHWDRPNSVILGRGDLPIDSLTGSVLASNLNSPLLLTQKDMLTESTAKEIARLTPENIFILGGKKGAISAEVEYELNKRFGNNTNILRIDGESRYDTAYQIAKKVMETSGSKEIFITTGDETSSDPLAIAPYAGENNIPILLSRSKTLNENIKRFIRDYDIKKATIIGGTMPVSNKVENELASILGANNVERVKGATRFETNVDILHRYYKLGSTSKLFIAQGFNTTDALSAAPMASRNGSPILLTKTGSVPGEIKNLLTNHIHGKPNLYFLGGTGAISKNTRSEFKEMAK